MKTRVYGKKKVNFWIQCPQISKKQLIFLSPRQKNFICRPVLFTTHNFDF